MATASATYRGPNATAYRANAPHLTLEVYGHVTTLGTYRHSVRHAPELAHQHQMKAVRGAGESFIGN